MSRHTSLSLLALSLSGALTTSCVESKCSLSEYACDPACMPHVQVTPSILSLAEDVESTISVTPTQCQWLQGLNTSIVQGANVFPIPQVGPTGEIKAKLGNISAINSNMSQLQSGKAALTVGEYRVEGLRLTPRFAKEPAKADISVDVGTFAVTAVGLISYKPTSSSKSVYSQIATLRSDGSTTFMDVYNLIANEVPGRAFSVKNLVTFSDKLPNTLAVSTHGGMFINGTSNNSIYESWIPPSQTPDSVSFTGAGRVSSLATDWSGSLYASIKGGKTEAFSDSKRAKALSVLEPGMQTTRYLVLVGDLDGDRRGDVVSWDATGQHPVVAMQDPMQGTSLLLNTQFQIPDVSIDSKTARVPVALADLDGDGLADLVNATKDGIQIYYNNGDGTFYKETATIGPLQNAKSVQALAVAVPTADGSGVRGLVWVATESGKPTLNVLKY